MLLEMSCILEKEAKKKDESISSLFIFKRRINLHPEKVISDIVELELNFAEAVIIVTNGKFPLTQESATTLAALQLLIKNGDYNTSKSNILTTKNLDQFVSKNLLEILNLPSNAVKSWVDTINSTWSGLAGTSTAEAKATFLQHMREWKLYGSQLFCVEQRKKPKRAILAFSKDAIYVLDQMDLKKEIIMELPWSQIASWRGETGKFHLNGGTAIKPIKLTFTTSHSTTPLALVSTCEDYVHMLKQNRESRAKLSNAKDRIREARMSRFAAQERLSALLARKGSLGKRNSSSRQSALIQQDFNFENATKKK